MCFYLCGLDFTTHKSQSTISTDGLTAAAFDYSMYIEAAAVPTIGDEQSLIDKGRLEERYLL